MVGFFMLPDYNIPLKRVNGRLNWLGILKFLWYRQIDQGRVIAICSLQSIVGKWRLDLFRNARWNPKGKPYKRAELSWVYEDNFP